MDLRSFLDLEMITYQSDDKIVRELADGFNKIKAESLQLENTTFDMKDRFGWRCKFVYSPTTPFATIPVAPRINNALGKNFSSVYQYIHKSLGSYDITKAKSLDEQISVMDKKDQQDVYAYVKNSFD